MFHHHHKQTLQIENAIWVDGSLHVVKNISEFMGPM
jgi:hypothetical protein